MVTFNMPVNINKTQVKDKCKHFTSKSVRKKWTNSFFFFLQNTLASISSQMANHRQKNLFCKKLGMSEIILALQTAV